MHLSFVSYHFHRYSFNTRELDADGFFHDNDILETNQNYGEVLFSAYLALLQLPIGMKY